MKLTLIILSLGLVSVCHGSTLQIRPHGARLMDPEIVEWLLEKADAHEADINHDIEETEQEQHVATVEEVTAYLEKESSTVKQQEANVTEIPSEEQLEEENLEEDNKLDNQLEEENLEEDNKLDNQLEEENLEEDNKLDNQLEEKILEEENKLDYQLEEENLEEENKLDNHVDTQSVTNASVTLEATSDNQINEAIQVDTDKTDELSHRNIKTSSLEAASKERSDEGSSILNSKENTNNVEEDLAPAKAFFRRVLDEGRRIVDKITWPFRQLGKSILKVFPSYIERKSLLK